MDKADIVWGWGVMAFRVAGAISLLVVGVTAVLIAMSLLYGVIVAIKHGLSAKKTKTKAKFSGAKAVKAKEEKKDVRQD